MLRPSAGETLRAWLLSALVVHGAVAGNPDAKRLYDDLLSNYNKLVRPVVNTSDVLRVCIKLKLSQLIDVLHSKPEKCHHGYVEQCEINARKFKSERDAQSVWSKEWLNAVQDNIETEGQFPYHYYDETCEGIRSSLMRKFLSPRNLESKVISNSLEAESTKRKTAHSSYALKSKRKSRKANRSESFSKKFKDVDNMSEFKKLLENFRIINEEECDTLSEDSRNIVPAYFVLKLAEKSENDLKKTRSHSKTKQGFKLIFAKDNAVKNEVEKKLRNRSSSSLGKTKDKSNQNSDFGERGTKGNNLENEIKKFADEETITDLQNCFLCSKLEQEIKFQREFNAGILEQLKNMVAQLSTVTGLLTDIINNQKNQSAFIENTLLKDHYSQNVLKLEESTDPLLNVINLDTSDIFSKSFQSHEYSEPAKIESCSIRTRESSKMIKNDFGSINKSVSAKSSTRKNQVVVSAARTETVHIRDTPIPSKTLSFDEENNCCCAKNPCHNRKTESYKRIKKNRSDCVQERLSKKKENTNECPVNNYYEEEDADADYGKSDEETENCYVNTEVEEVIGKSLKQKRLKAKTVLCKDQVRLNLNETGSESNGNEASLSNEENIKLSSRASSRRNLKNQIMTTNLWVEQSWYDYKLRWDPKEYGGVHMLHVPSDHIWRPDIVLYNNADGNYEVTLMTKARVSHTGLVEWQPPAVYKSSCAIDVEFFPYDIQTCVLKLGSWTYDGFKVDLRHMDEKAGSNVVEVGVDLSEFYMSVEWDILEVPAVRNEKFYTCCDEPYLDITFNITMRRKTLFYTVNIIIPCMGISFLTVLTFYLPSDSGEKVTLSISILISLHVFFLLVVEIIPPTSLVVPLLGKYLIFAMILVSISICVTVVVLNVHFRSPQTHRMAPWVKRVFIHILPRLLVMRRPQYHFEPHRFMSRRVIMQTVKGKEIQTSYYPYPYQASAPTETPKIRDIDSMVARQRAISKEDFSPESLADGEPMFGGSCQIHGPPPQSESEELSLSGVEGGVNGEDLKSPTIKNPAFSHSMCPPEVHKSCFCVRFIAEHTKMLEDSTKVKEDWKYVAMVLDRLFLWIFTLAVLVGTAGIILQAPTLYDDRIPIDKQFAEIQTSTVIRCPPQ